MEEIEGEQTKRKSQVGRISCSRHADWKGPSQKKSEVTGSKLWLSKLVNERKEGKGNEAMKV